MVARGSGSRSLPNSELCEAEPGVGDFRMDPPLDFGLLSTPPSMPSYEGPPYRVGQQHVPTLASGIPLSLVHTQPSPACPLRPHPWSLP